MNADFIEASIMIVDDEPDNLTVLAAMLHQKGWGVRAFPSGELALASAHAEPPELMLLDIRMPGMDGYEVCRRLKADEGLRQIPVIFLSAFSQPSDKVRAFEVGGVDYVSKPFAETEVLARVYTHLRLHRHQLNLEALVGQRVHELAEAHRRLRIWDDAKNQWLNTLSHEMRAPLTGIFGIAELLFAELPPDSEVHAIRKNYAISRRRIEKLMDDATMLAKIDVAAERFDMRPLRLTQVLQSVLSELVKQASDVAVNASIAAVRDVTVFGEPKLLERAFLDLLLTVTHCIDAGEAITLETRIVSGYAKVMIVTGGKSLPPEAIETFFDVGGQHVLLKGGGDFGLGSALASRIIRLFDGHISVCNGMEQGLVMEISLPVAITPHE